MKTRKTPEKSILCSSADLKLIQDTLNGSAEAFAQLVENNKNRVEAVGHSFFSSKEDIEDFVQDVFFRAFKSLANFRGECQFSTWLTEIAYSTAINRKNRTKSYESIANETLIESRLDTPEEQYIKKATRKAVKEAVDELPERYKICVDLYFFYDLSHDEISRITELPVNTIKTHIFRAKKILVQKLQEYK